ncbi:RdRP-domain-containing protein, partial [Neoconidiobolus thromboides FSU 785]
PSHSVLVRKVAITPTKIYLLPATLEMTNRVIRQYSSVKDRFLRVVFCDENMRPLGANKETNHDILIRFFCILRYGLKISDRRYRLLAFSSSQLREHGCWFFSDTEDITVEAIHQWMGDFSSIHNVAKYAARMGQCFSSSKDGAELENYNVTEIPDIKRNGWTFSDGVGKISSELLKKIDGKLDLPNPPSAIQFRMGGYKGVVTLSPELEGEQLCLRPSQKKFESNHLVLEVIRIANYRCAHLNRQVIILLTALGIEDSVFIELQNEMVQELSKMKQSLNKAISVLANHTDEYGVAKSLIKLIQANLFHSKDNYIRNMLDLVYIYVLTNLKNKARIQVPKGALLIGVMDEYGVLNEGEIFVQCSNSENLNDFKIVTGECIVTRNPCFHPGDVRVVTAVDKKELKHLVNVVVFPSTGYRDIPSQCSGGDLDGDEFIVIWDPRLIPSLKNERPMSHLPAKPKFLEKIETLDICIFFINYILNDNLGAIANSHLALSDARHNGVYDTDCLTLAQRHSRAVDFPKTGIPADLENELRAKEFPDFMQKEDKPMYTSKKLLGKLYRSLTFGSFSPTNSFDLNPILRVEGYETYIASAIRNKAAYDSAIENLMLQHGINNELEVVSGYILNHREMGKKRSYRVRVSLMEAMEDIKKDFRTI